MLSHMVGLATPIGMVIAWGEVAIGVGVLFGLWTRVAAIGGAFLSFNLFLTVSFHASPYFTGADIVFFFAWMPLIIAGSSSRLSVDAWVANYVAKKEGRARREFVAIAFADVQRLCGKFKHDTCVARGGLACDATECPVLLGQLDPKATPVEIASFERRSLLVGGVAAASVAAAAAIVGGTVAETGKLIGNATTTTQASTLGSGGSTSTSTGGSTYAGTLLGSGSKLVVGTPTVFTDPKTGDPGIIFRESNNVLLAYDTVCPHMGCTVGYSPSAKILACPCHGSEFKVSNGDVISGPAPHGLTKLNVVLEPDGNIYLK